MNKDIHSFYKIIFKKNYFLLLGYTRKYILDKQVAEDIVQDVFLDVWRNRDSIDFETRPIMPYLFRSAYNKSLNYIHSQYNQRSKEDIDLDLALHVRLMDANPLDNVQLEEMKSEIVKCVEALPDKCKKIFIYSRHKHKANKEIAELLNIGEKTVEYHLTTALKKIREHLYAMKLLP